MDNSTKPFFERKKATKLSEVVAKELSRLNLALIEDYTLWKIISDIYEKRSITYLRGSTPKLSTLQRIKDILKSEQIITRDHDYNKMWRVNQVSDVQADEIVCLVDESTCISHLSAMQIFNLTDRRPRSLYITVGPNDHWSRVTNANLNADDKDGPKRYRRHHRKIVRDRNLEIFHTKRYPNTTRLKSSHVRVTDIGETFLNMLEQPERCGGMAHVIDVFTKHAPIYLSAIVDRIEKADKKLTKVRAGYILTELLGLKNLTVENWMQFAQRGGSQRLDPTGPYKPVFSEQWMISLNV
ncbi:hypothetical protein LPB140_00915 [Sphingorhabdus lutea]|uniref:AbiEi antitoxin C-terminal domain-containing protein n=1 Tax=Sphingorhabdus lutea TaxID=1913578 RepID=A0A1L3J936_9SPHN|nr:hypothetical protein [Sphingorhabdus lutea]APG61635.1 hypothetical protein LPB140_00915 [Sphingorhabdus lutea]